MSTYVKKNGVLVKVSGLDNSHPVQRVSASNYMDDTPVGTIIAYMGTTIPEHYLLCDGTLYNIADYPDLAENFKTSWGVYNKFGGDGVTTFAVPDLRGEFLRGAGTNGHSNCGNGAAVGGHQDPTEVPRISGYRSTGNNFNIQFGRPTSENSNLAVTNPDKTSGTSSGTLYMNGTLYDSNNNQPFRYSTRPTNTSISYLIKCESTYYMQVNEPDYSTVPVNTGRKWIDGKDIWKVTVKTMAPSSAEVDQTIFKVEDVAPNYERILKYDGYLIPNGGTLSNNMRQLNYYHQDADYIASWVGASGEFRMRISASYVNLEIATTIEYTKK